MELFAQPPAARFAVWVFFSVLITNRTIRARHHFPDGARNRCLIEPYSNPAQALPMVSRAKRPCVFSNQNGETYVL
jgi:hypothetical protein